MTNDEQRAYNATDRTASSAMSYLTTIVVLIVTNQITMRSLPKRCSQVAIAWDGRRDTCSRIQGIRRGFPCSYLFPFHEQIAGLHAFPRLYTSDGSRKCHPKTCPCLWRNPAQCSKFNATPQPVRRNLVGGFTTVRGCLAEIGTRYMRDSSRRSRLASRRWCQRWGCKHRKYVPSSMPR